MNLQGALHSDTTGITIVQQTSCELICLDVRSQWKMYFFVPSVHPYMYISQIWCDFRKAYIQRLHVAYNFGCSALCNYSSGSNVAFLSLKP